MQTLELCLTRDDLSRPWGFRLQGGVDTGYPLSVQRVFSGSPAKGVLQRGDVLQMLDNCESQNLNSTDIQNIIRASDKNLNCIVQRIKIESNNQDLIADSEPKISVTSARKKFISLENSVPKPFKEFGTYYEKKDDTLPTNIKIDRQNHYNSEQNSNHYDETEVVDDIVDYSFMSLSVKERKKLFNTPNDTVINQRSYGISSAQKEKAVINNPKQNTKQFGYQHMKTPKSIAGNQYSTPRPLIDKPFLNKNDPSNIFTDTHATIDYKEPFRQFSNEYQGRATHSNYMQPTSNWTGISEDSNPRITKYVYRCGTGQDDVRRSDRSSEPRTLVVKTYPIQSIHHGQSPRTPRPAYSTRCQQQHIGDTNSSFITSQPFSNVSDKNEIFRQNPHRYTNSCLGVIKFDNSNTNQYTTPIFQTNAIISQVDGTAKYDCGQPIQFCNVGTNKLMTNVTINTARHTVPSSNHGGNPEAVSDF